MSGHPERSSPVAMANPPCLLCHPQSLPIRTNFGPGDGRMNLWFAQRSSADPATTGLAQFYAPGMVFGGRRVSATGPDVLQDRRRPQYLTGVPAEPLLAQSSSEIFF